MSLSPQPSTTEPTPEEIAAWLAALVPLVDDLWLDASRFDY
jgi:hypothetical protein